MNVAEKRVLNSRNAMRRGNVLTILVVGFLLVASTGCVPRRAIYVNLTDKIEITPTLGGTVMVRAAVRVENHNPKSLYLNDASFDSWYGGSDLAKITLPSPVEVRAKSIDTVWVPLEARFVSAGRMLTFALQGGVDDWQNVEVEGYARVRYGVGSKKVRITRRKLKELTNF